MPTNTSPNANVKSPERQNTTETRNLSEQPWNVVVYNDPVNLMEYVTHVLKKLFGYSKGDAKNLMMTVHTRGKATVWSGNKEKAEIYVAQLHLHQLHAGIHKNS